MFRGNIKRWRSHPKTASSHSTIVRHTIFLQNLQVIRSIQIRPISLTFHLPTMRSLIYLPALLLLPLPAFGLPSRMNVVNSRQVNDTDTNGTSAASVSPLSVHRIGWWCGTRTCSPGKKVIEHSKIKSRASTSTPANSTAVNNTLSGDGKHSLWWCGTKPCGSSIKMERENIDDSAISNKNYEDPASSEGPIGWTCPDGEICPPKSGESEDGQTNNTAINDTATNNMEKRDWIGTWTCPNGKICPPKIKRAESGPTDNTAIDDTAANNIGKRFAPPGYWCGTHVCPPGAPRMKSVKRQIDTTTSETSEPY